MKVLKSTILSLLALATMSACMCGGSNPGEDTLHIDIIPQPTSLTQGEGRFTINRQTRIVAEESVSAIADYLTQYIPLKKGEEDCANTIRLTTDNSLPEEGYTLRIDNNGIAICGGSYGGLFNGVQSLLQLLPHRVYSKSGKLPMTVAHISVEDAPKFHYRGYLLDVARTYQPVQEIKRVIDYMALCKLNKLHLHLVDNPAWRLEIKKYPHFAKIGGFRGGDSPLHPIYGRFDEKYGGYYTQEELRELVAYAAIRNIEIIPEIDMPGHSKSLGVAHPDILCNYTPDTSYTNGIDIRNVWCVGKESNYTIIEDIIKELVEIFPSEYIHIGGDEVKFSWWTPCPDCQRLMREHNLKDGPQLEQFFLNRVTDILAKYDRKPIVWDEAVNGGLLPHTTLVTGWRHHGRGWHTSIENGYQTIVMPSTYFYLDKRQSTHERGHRSGSGGLDLKKLCNFDFSIGGFTDEQLKLIAGVEGAFWGEIYLENIDRNGRFSDYLEYMTFPRLFAISELGWSAKRRSYEEMLPVVEGNFYHKLNAMGSTFRLTSPIVKIEGGKLIATTNDGSKLYYRDIRENKIHEYNTPLDASLAPFVLFKSKLLTGYSNEVGADIFYNHPTPAHTFTTSMPCRNLKKTKRTSVDKSVIHTSRCAKKGDWFEFRFEEPVKCTYLKVRTGYEHLHRCLIYNGHIEVCYDGKNFERIADLNDGEYELMPNNRPIYAVRIVADGISDAEDRVVLQPIIVK